MIIPNLKTIYIHIPKTGGTTIGNLLHPDDPIQDRDENSLGTKYSDYFIDPAMHTAEHLSYDQYTEKLLSLGLHIQYFYVFTFIRNPYSRMYSTWKFLRYQKQINNPIYHMWDIEQLNTFKSFICNLKETGHFHEWCIPQTKFALSTNCNFIGRYENFNHDLTKLLQRFGIQADIPHLNKTSSNIDEYKIYLNKDIQNIIYQYYQSDFIEYNYSYFI